MSIVGLPSFSTPARKAPTAARSRPCSLMNKPSTIDRRGTVGFARERRHGANRQDVESLPADVASQCPGGSLSTVLDVLLATDFPATPRLHSGSVRAIDCKSDTCRPGADGVDDRSVRHRRSERGSPARGERPPIHASVATRAFRGAAPRGGRSPLAGVFKRRLACDVSVADMRTTPAHRRLGVVI